MPDFIYLLIISWIFKFFHFLAIMNNAATNMCVQVFVWIYVSISLGYISRSELLFWGTVRVFSKAAAPFRLSISTIVYEGSNVCTSFPRVTVVHLFSYSHLGIPMAPWRMVVIWQRLRLSKGREPQVTPRWFLTVVFFFLFIFIGV